MNKKVTALIAIIIVLIMALIGTFAWTQYNQHKTNEASGDGIRYDVSLIEDFQEITDWKVNQPYKKEIRVKNTGTDSISYGDVFVRLQLKEYMEMMDLTPIYSQQRYMVDEEGVFIKATDADALLGRLADLGITNRLSVTDLATDTGLEDGSQSYYYVPTRAGDDNGQYGKYLLKEMRSETAEKLFGDAPRAATPADAYHHATGGNAECNYTVHKWTATPEEPGNCGLPSHTYIQWNLGSDVMTYDEWVAPAGNDKAPVEAWIFDTRPENTQGWVYWGMPLVPGRTTSNLLKSIELTRQPDKDFYYAIHVDMQAVSLKEIDVEWDDAPEDLRAMLTTRTATVLPAWVGDITGVQADVGKTFTVDGIEWQVLTADGSGNMLILATANQGENTDFNLEEYVSYEDSTLDGKMKEYDADKIPALYPFMQYVILNTESTWVYASYDPPYPAYQDEGMSTVGTSVTGVKKAFALSVDELITYGVNVPAGGSWWLRSPGEYDIAAAYVYTDGGISNHPVFAGDDVGGGGVRPALWINLRS